MQSSVRQKTGALFVPDLMHNGVYTVLFSLEVNLTGILCAYDLAFPLLEFDASDENWPSEFSEVQVEIQDSSFFFFF